jgi:hypothetical protein
MKGSESCCYLRMTDGQGQNRTAEERAFRALTGARGRPFVAASRYLTSLRIVCLMVCFLELLPINTGRLRLVSNRRDIRSASFCQAA